MPRVFQILNFAPTQANPADAPSRERPPQGYSFKVPTKDRLIVDRRPLNAAVPVAPVEQTLPEPRQVQERFTKKLQATKKVKSVV